MRGSRGKFARTGRPRAISPRTPPHPIPARIGRPQLGFSPSPPFRRAAVPRGRRPPHAIPSGHRPSHAVPRHRLDPRGRVQLARQVDLLVVPPPFLARAAASNARTDSSCSSSMPCCCCCPIHVRPCCSEGEDLWDAMIFYLWYYL
jgi:hypothetical protein